MIAKKWCFILILSLFVFGTAFAESGLQKIQVSSDPRVYTTVKISGFFENEESIPVKVRLDAEIYYRGRLVDFSSSGDIVMPPNSKETTSVYFEPSFTGEYTAVVTPIFNQKVGEAQEIKIDVMEMIPPITLGTTELVLSLIGICVLVFVLHFGFQKSFARKETS